MGRRVAALLLSLCTPGLGHAALGCFGRAAFWFGAQLVLLGVSLGAVALEAPWAIWAAFGLTLVAWIAAAGDVLACRRAASPPAIWVVALLAGCTWGCQLMASDTLRSRVSEGFVAQGPAMAPTVDKGDRFLVTKLPRSYRRGDIVVFTLPAAPSKLVLKRIVAVGGDTVEQRNGVLHVNGHAAHREPLTPAGVDGQRRWSETLGGTTYEILTANSPSRRGPSTPVRVPEGTVFVLGDNRDSSHDSRVFGSVSLERITGKLLFVWWRASREGP